MSNPNTYEKLSAIQSGVVGTLSFASSQFLRGILSVGHYTFDDGRYMRGRGKETLLNSPGCSHFVCACHRVLVKYIHTYIYIYMCMWVVVKATAATAALVLYTLYMLDCCWQCCCFVSFVCVVGVRSAINTIAYTRLLVQFTLLQFS